MTDLEITKRCAVAMGLIPMEAPGGVLTVIDGSREHSYLPLHNDAQAMALVKKFKIDCVNGGENWCAMLNLNDANYSHGNADLNRAICECVAKMAPA